MLISYRERYKRMREAHEEAWEHAGKLEGDPGLREVYEQFPRSQIRLICCQLTKDVNQGGLLRLAEAFRLERVDFSPEEDDAVDMAGNRGTKRWQPYRWIPAENAVAEAKEEGFFTVAITLNERAIPIEQVEWRYPLAIVLGEEKYGIPQEVEGRCEVSAAIPLYGIITALNVTTAGAIALHAATSAYARQNPEFEPARSVSRRLLGLPPVNYP
jgi:tRNA G18 (ribose-2'-O)-methylase SpoU